MEIPQCATPAMARISLLPTSVHPVGQAPLLSSWLWGCWAPGLLRHKVWPRAARPVGQRGLHHPSLQHDSLFSAVLHPLNCQPGSRSPQQGKHHGAKSSLMLHAPALLLLLPLPSHDVMCWKAFRKGNRRGGWGNLLAARPPFSWWRAACPPRCTQLYLWHCPSAKICDFCFNKSRIARHVCQTSKGLGLMSFAGIKWSR